MSPERRAKGATRITAILACVCVILAAAFAFAWFLPLGKVSYSSGTWMIATTTAAVEETLATHIPTPASVRAIYVSSWAAGSDKFRKEIADLLSTTEINAVVIDVKDYSGRISFPVDDPKLIAIGSAQNRIPDIQEYIRELHSRGIYVIGRISSFQDSFLIQGHPEWAVKTLEGNVWQDYHGVKWLDAGATPVWDYLAQIGRQAYAYGFDELNFDYIRFPSDGNLKDIAYSWRAGRTREEVMKGFYDYLHATFASASSTPRIPISADLFGLVTSATDDLGIGQVLADALPDFDYVAPMVYPSHYAKGFNGYAKPAEHPYEVIKYAMDHATARAVAASTSPDKIRPWLQDFDLGAIYTPDMVRAQMKAAYDTGLDSWMLWNAGVIYHKDALLPKGSPEPVASSTLGRP